MRRFDLVEELDKANVDYLFVASSPIRTAQPGRKYSYHLEVKSKLGGVRFSLEGGPPGMTLSNTGRLEWSVPTSYQEKVANVIISIRDALGQEMFHTFKIAVQPATTTGPAVIASLPTVR